MQKEVILHDIGIGDYQEVWAFQQKLFDETLQIKSKNRTDGLETPTQNHLIYVEHPHVYTLGKSGDEANMLLTEQMLSHVDAQFVRIDRGGDVTYHGPGQLVGYPILDLHNFDIDIKGHIFNLEEAIIQYIDEFGLKGTRVDGATGVWLDVGTPKARKICAIGVRTSRWVTMHGFALNVNTDLKYFEYINPCGFTDRGVTSLEKEIGEKLNMDSVKAKMNYYLSEVFGMEIQAQTHIK